MTPISNVETIRLADWSGFTDFGGTTQVYAPKNEHEIVDLVRYCRDNRKKLRVVGLQTSWNTLWYCEDVMMTTKYLNKIIDIDRVNHTITCEAGATLGEIHRELWAHGLTLDRAPAVDWVTVGGSISTGSHGSGPASNSSSMIACRLITADGTILEIDEHDELLDAVRISVGTLGILSTITLRVVDRFYVYMQRSHIPTREWKRFLTEGEMSYLLWFPHTEYSVLARVDKITDPAEASRRSAECSSKGFDPNDPEDRKRVGIDLKEYSDSIAGLANVLPSTFPARNRFLLDVFFQDIEKVGPAYEVLMSFESDPIAGGEWSVPVDRFEAAFAELQREVTQGDLFLPIVWLKKVKGESAWLRAADGDCIQCGIYHSLVRGTPTHVKEMVTRVERLMLRHGGRPHLGKLIYLDPADLRSVYPNWNRFNALRKQMDPNGMFWSRLLAATFGDGDQMTSIREENVPLTDRIPGVMADTVVRLFARGEAFDSNGFATFFTDNPMYQFGNGEPCLNKAAIIDSVTNFFGMVDALYHDIRNIWEDGDTVFVEMDVTYWRKDGTSITLPCADIFRFEGDKIQELRIFMDANPMFNRSMAVGDKASVMTISEGKRVVPPGIMRRYFSEHAEGIQRIANGYAPKWSTAGPKWPTVPKMEVLTDFQGAISAGNWELFKTFLTRDAVLRVGNRAEVIGPQAISETLRDLFTRELRATGADFTGVWEPDNSLVVEMNVQATRPSDGRRVEYPCVETYRFEGQKISEWRIYPLEPTLLATEGWR
jgi:FAD/FMN-containing dehydrogenase/ketosteroid isomerase-like protein